MNNRSFTLIELLVVIAIVGILSGVVLMSSSGAVNSANDVRIKNDIDSIRKALLSYKALYGAAPVEEDVCDIGSTCSQLSSDLLAINPNISFPTNPLGGYYTYQSTDGATFTIATTLSNSQILAYDSENGYSQYTGLVGYSKRKSIIINSSASLTDYQVKVNITYDSDMQADFDDIRFTDSGGTTQLNYWLESKIDSTSAVFWVKVSSLSIGDNTIYAYYGNGSVSTASSGSSTFIQWHGLATAAFQDPYICTGPFVYEAYVKETSDGRLGFGLSNTEWPGDDDTAYIYTYTYRYIYSINDTYTTDEDESPALTTDVYVKLKIIHTGTSIDAYIDDNQIGTTITTNLPDEAMGLMLYVGTGSATHDWSFVRKYTATEPTISSWGSEESF